MRQILFLAVAVVVGGTYAARFADQRLMHAPPPAVARVQPATPAPVTVPEQLSYGRTLTLTADRQGHFEVRARIDGRHIHFLVDTGASLVVLRASAAAKLGIYPVPDDYTAVVSTANGRIKAAPIKLDSIEIGDIAVDDVPALVLTDAALSRNLLGVSFLAKLRRYAVADGRMILEQ